MDLNIQKGTPEKKGVYVGYVDLPFDSDFMEKKLLFWQEGEWWYCGSDQKYRGYVSCWIGPLPSPSKKELLESNEYRFAIGTKESVDKGAFLEGPFRALHQAVQYYGNEGEYILKISDSKIEPVRRWSESKLGWVCKRNKKE